jgi:hypothetical protein
MFDLLARRSQSSIMEQSDRHNKLFCPETTADEPSSKGTSKEMDELRLAGLSETEIHELNEADRQIDHLFRNILGIPYPRTLPDAPAVELDLLRKYVSQFDQLTSDEYAKVEGNCLDYANWRAARGQVIREILGTSQLGDAKSRADE